MMIWEEFRLFSCKLCGQTRVICSSCDRGHRYCSKECSKEARRQSVCAAGRRYQKTEAGIAKHAARQAAYLLRQAKRAVRQAAYLLRLAASGCFSEKDDASGYPNSGHLLHTHLDDAENDLGDAFCPLEPLNGGLRCCLCGAWCRSKAA